MQTLWQRGLEAFLPSSIVQAVRPYYVALLLIEDVSRHDASSGVISYGIINEKDRGISVTGGHETGSRTPSCNVIADGGQKCLWLTWCR